MALHPCPECRKKISQSAPSCPHCGFVFSEANQARYRALLEQRRLHNQAINRQSAKLHLVWLAVFIVVIACAWLFTGR